MKLVKISVAKKDFESKSAIFLPEKAVYDYLSVLSESEDMGKAINDTMKAICYEYEIITCKL